MSQPDEVFCQRRFLCQTLILAAYVTVVGAQTSGTVTSTSTSTSTRTATPCAGPGCPATTWAMPTGPGDPGFGEVWCDSDASCAGVHCQADADASPSFCNLGTHRWCVFTPCLSPSPTNHTPWLFEIVPIHETHFSISLFPCSALPLPCAVNA